MKALKNDVQNELSQNQIVISEFFYKPPTIHSFLNKVVIEK